MLINIAHKFQNHQLPSKVFYSFLQTMIKQLVKICLPIFKHSIKDTRDKTSIKRLDFNVICRYAIKNI